MISLAVFAILGCHQADPEGDLGIFIHRPEEVSAHAPKSCQGGCAFEPDDDGETLSGQGFRDALAEVASLPPGSPSQGLDTLLFYAEDTLAFIDAEGTEPLSEIHVAFLTAELERTAVVVQMRIIDEEGAIRGEEDESIPLGIKQHLHLENTGSLGRVESGGTVKRVGLNHLWSRW